MQEFERPDRTSPLLLHLFEGVHALQEVDLGWSSECFVKRRVVDADDRGGEERIRDEGWALAKGERLAPSRDNTVDEGELAQTREGSLGSQV